MSFPKVGAVPGGKPFETFGKDSIMLRRRKHGTTGQLALPHQHRRKVRLLRPSVQLPAGIHGCAVYKDFGRYGKDRDVPKRSILIYLFVCHTNKSREDIMARKPVETASETSADDPKHAAREIGRAHV